ncbi:hypothetical protein D0Z07_4893 [Hyphodiscus hymeniophilus]|uniref:Uncharacterized protein n=1 Tax=Hyphodiscus hymeniophilus TaxID=353542 RepID=A0A9P6VJI2_9HELO|nr:hypothetical protein D0Z07_4893 [Hyphodiscus hymeniophilus]
MNSVYGVPAYGGGTGGYETVETLLDDVSRQMASSNLTKYSRGSGGQRPSAGSMRIAKPNSTSNSPRGSIGLGRRRTVMSDRRRMALGEQNMAAPAGFVSNDGLQLPTRSNRPVSWHPSSQMPQPQYHTTYQIPTFQRQPDFHAYDLSQTPAVYSGYGSPDSTFSPLSMPYSAYEQNYTQPGNATPYDSSQGYQSNQHLTPSDMPYYSTQADIMDSAMHSHMDWDNFAASGFENSTSPPTPEFFLPIQHAESHLPAEDAIPYHSLSDSEPEGEILQGLGLYDTPDVPKSPPSTGQLDHYRALIMSQLLGTSYRKAEPESTGKGLKLEETWNPPPSDDDDDDEDDDELDGEGDDDDEEPATHHSISNNTFTQRGDAFMDASRIIPDGVQANQDLHSSWL